MVDLEKVYAAVNTFMVSSSFFDILKRRLFFPENIMDIYKECYIVKEIESVEELKDIEFLSKAAGVHPEEHLSVLKEGVKDREMYRTEDFVSFKSAVIESFEMFVKDAFPLLFPEVWKKENKEKYTDEECEYIFLDFIFEGVLVLQLTLCSISLSEFYRKAQRPSSERNWSMGNWSA